MLRAITLAIVLLVASSVCWADVCPQQIVTTSWPGLTGLYIIPTARIVGPRKLAIGFNESKHTEFISNGKYTDRQIRGVLTYGITDRIEASAAYYNDMFVIPPGIKPQLHNETFTSFGAKVQVLQESRNYWFPAVAVGVRDIANDTADVFPLRNVNNGTTGFLVASKKALKDDKIGRFMDCHAGFTFNRHAVTGFGGFELTLAPNASLIAESMWDSPYLNFRRFGANNQSGRYLFNVGLRIYPELLPGLVLDTGFIGDGEFEFSFAASFVATL